MKRFMIICLMGLSLSFNVNAKIVKYVESGTFESSRTMEQTLTGLTLQVYLNSGGALSLPRSQEIATVANNIAKEFEVPTSIILAIAFVESSYQLNAVNKRSSDYGIMQVNAWHVKHSKLSKYKLLNDLEYSFYHGIRIFAWFYVRYPLREAIAKYNCGFQIDKKTGLKCPEWKKVKKYVDRVFKSM